MNMHKPRFEAQVGMYSEIGHRHAREGGVNEDFMGAYTANPNILAAALCDGMGGAPDGAPAAEVVVNGFVGGVRDLSRQNLSMPATDRTLLNRPLHSIIANL